MYSIVLMMALSDGAALPGAKPVEFAPVKRAGAQEHNRGGRGCWGCRGCWGGCHGCWGGCWGCYGGCWGCYGGCWGGGVAYRSHYYAPGYYSYYYPATSYQSYYAGQPQQQSQTAPAQLVVQLPADARLTIDGTATQQTSSRRVFVTPPLDRGYNYSYTLTATAVRNGQTVTTTKQIPISAGAVQEVRLDFKDSEVAQR